MGGETTDLVRASFRFSRGSSVYVAEPRGKYWNVTLQGHNEAWMFWFLTDEDIVKSCWGTRLTD